jgi:hypothetical protein
VLLDLFELPIVREESCLQLQALSSTEVLCIKSNLVTASNLSNRIAQNFAPGSHHTVLAADFVSLKHCMQITKILGNRLHVRLTWQDFRSRFIFPCPVYKPEIIKVDFLMGVNIIFVDCANIVDNDLLHPDSRIKVKLFFF